MRRLALRAELPYASVMAKLTRSMALLLGVASTSFILEGSALAQGAAPPASAAFPPSPTEQAPSVAPLPPAAVAPAPAPLPTPPTPPPGSNAAAGPAYPEPQPYGQARRSEETASPDGYPGGDPPPPPKNPNDGFQRPELSVRIDPLNLLLEGRLGLELETQVYKLLSLEIVPVFVTTKQPPTYNYSKHDGHLSQESNGLGAISGAAIDAGIWFGGKPLEGNVLRLGLTNYAYTYSTSVDGGTSDSLSHTDRQFFAMYGSHSRWGAFTLEFAFGLAYELNQKDRCYVKGVATTTCSTHSLELKTAENGSGQPSVLDIQSLLYPFDFLGRISLGVVF